MKGYYPAKNSIGGNRIMDNKPKVSFYTVLAIVSLLLVQYGIVVFLVGSFMYFAIGIPYESWQLIGKVIVLTTTIIFYYLYKKADSSKGRKATYKIYLIGFIIFSVEIGAFYGYLYLIGI